MANDDKKAKYVPFWKPHPIDNESLRKTRAHLVRSIDELDNILNIKYKNSDFMAFDIETTGLDPTAEDAEIVGYSVSFDATDGYYVAIAHATGGDINLGDEGLQLVYDRMVKAKRTFIANLQFDFAYMEFESDRKGRNWDMSKVAYYDVFVGLFLADTNIKYPSLKGSAKFWLGWDLDSFENTLGDAWNFKYIDPEDAYTYGGRDSIMTFALAPISLKFYKEAKMSGKIDNEFLYPLTQMLKSTTRHDIEYVKRLKETLKETYDNLESEIYRLVGNTFNIGSPKQLSEALKSIGFDTGIVTKSGYMKAGMKELETQNEKTPHPIVSKLVEYKKISKSISTYVEPFLKEYNKRGNADFRYNYNLYSAPTCRMAGGKDGKNTYYTPINCIAGYTKLFTKDGVKEIKDVKVGDYVWDGENFNKVVKWYDNGIQHVYETVTQGGAYSLVSTDKHKIYASYDKAPDFIPLKDLDTNYSVMVNTKVYDLDMGIPNKNFNSYDKSLGGVNRIPLAIDINDKDVWLLLGWIFAGCSATSYKGKTSKLSLTFNTKYSSIMDTCINVLDKYGVNYKISPKNDNTSSTNVNILSTSFGCFCDYALGYIVGNSTRLTKALDIKMFKLQAELRISFIRGFFCNASHKASKGTSWGVKAKNITLLEDMKYLVQSIGIMAQLRVKGDIGTLTLLGGQQYNKFKLGVIEGDWDYTDMSRYQTLPMYLHKASSKLIRFYNNKYENPKSCIRYLDKGLGFDYDNLWTRIESITYKGEEHVYDIEVENTHRYIANGVLIHNCHAITKPKSKEWYVHDYKEGDILNATNVRVLDWRFSIEDESDYVIEASNPVNNLRNIFLPDENSYWCSIDFSAEELRLIANYSKSKVWTEAFVNGGDLHKMMAKFNRYCS